MFALFAFIVGLLFGSLLNVCISRLPRGESIVKPRSHCMTCGHLVRWYDNIPILSWLLLRARCRDCKAPIPWRYPLVELAIGAWFFKAGSQLWTYWHISTISSGDVIYPASTSTYYSIDILGFTILGFLLIGLMVMDWQTHRLPRRLHSNRHRHRFLPDLRAGDLPQSRRRPDPAPRRTHASTQPRSGRGRGQRLPHRPRSARLRPHRRHRRSRAAPAHHPLALQSHSPPRRPRPGRRKNADDDRRLLRLRPITPRPLRRRSSPPASAP